MKKRAFSVVLLLSSFMVYFFTFQDDEMVRKPASVKVEKEKKVFKKKKTKKSPLTTKQIVSFNKRKLNKLLHDIKFDLDEECPRKYTLKEEKDGEDLFSDCKGEIVYKEKLGVLVMQKFYNKKLSEYNYQINGIEPLSFEFNSKGELRDLNLLFEGQIVFSASFREGLVSRTHQNREQVVMAEDLSVDFGNPVTEARFSFLKRGKKKAEKILSSLCAKTGNRRTCTAASELRQFEYPIRKRP